MKLNFHIRKMQFSSKIVKNSKLQNARLCLLVIQRSMFWCVINYKHFVCDPVIRRVLVIYGYIYRPVCVEELYWLKYRFFFQEKGWRQIDALEYMVCSRFLKYIFRTARSFTIYWGTYARIYLRTLFLTHLLTSHS